MTDYGYLFERKTDRPTEADIDQCIMVREHFASMAHLYTDVAESQREDFMHWVHIAFNPDNDPECAIYCGFPSGEEYMVTTDENGETLIEEV